MSEESKLNENQQIVLDWLKNYVLSEAVAPIDTVGVFWKERNSRWQPPQWQMTGKEQAQVLELFAKWAQE